MQVSCGERHAVSRLFAHARSQLHSACVNKILVLKLLTLLAFGRSVSVERLFEIP